MFGWFQSMITLYYLYYIHTTSKNWNISQEKILYSRTKEIKLVEFIFQRQISGNKKASSECDSGDSCNLHNVHFTSKTGSDSKDQSWYLYLYFIFSCPWRLASNSKAQTWQFWCFMCFTCVIKYLLFFNSNIQGWKMLFVYFSSFFSLSHFIFCLTNFNSAFTEPRLCLSHFSPGPDTWMCPA